MKMNAASILLGGALLCRAFPQAFAAYSVRGGSPGLAAGVALAVDGMLTAGSDSPRLGYDLEFLARLNETMPVRDENRAGLKPETIQQDVSVQKTADPLVLALLEAFPGIGDNPTPDQIRAATPRAKAIVAQRERALRQSLPKPDERITGDLEAIHAARKLSAAGALDLMLYNGAYTPREHREDLWTLNKDWARAERDAAAALDRLRNLRSRQAVTGTTGDWGGRGESAEASLSREQSGDSKIQSGLRPSPEPGDVLEAGGLAIPPIRDLTSQGRPDNPFPLSHTLDKFFRPLTQAASHGSDVEFWRLARRAFADIEVRTLDVLDALPTSAWDARRRIGVVQRLAIDAAELGSRILEIYGEHPAEGMNMLSAVTPDLVSKINLHNPAVLATKIGKARDEDPKEAADYLVKYVALWKSWIEDAPSSEQGGLRGYMIKGDAMRSLPPLNELSWSHRQISERVENVPLRGGAIAVLSLVALYGVVQAAPVILKHASWPWLLAEIPFLLLGLWGIFAATTKFVKAWDLFQAGRWINQTLARFKS